MLSFRERVDPIIASLNLPGSSASSNYSMLGVDHESLLDDYDDTGIGIPEDDDRNSDGGGDGDGVEFAGTICACCGLGHPVIAFACYTQSMASVF